MPAECISNLFELVLVCLLICPFSLFTHTHKIICDSSEKKDKFFQLTETERFQANILIYDTMDNNNFSPPVSKAVYQFNFTISSFVISSNFVASPLNNTSAKCILGWLNGIKESNKNYFALGINLFTEKYVNI